uniref:Uncharacterized protein n=1 Tax=Cucumis melo TaxID=3656 RepID=A0A9I9CYY6_CUCME
MKDRLGWLGDWRVRLRCRRNQLGGLRERLAAYKGGMLVSDSLETKNNGWKTIREQLNRDGDRRRDRCGLNGGCGLLKNEEEKRFNLV